MGAGACMTSQPETTAKASRAGATPPCRCLPEEIVIWEILIRLPPKSVLRCRAVCRAWRRATSTCEFLLVHHDRQPSLPFVWGQLVSGSEYDGALYKHLFTLDHRATDAQLQPVVQLDQSYHLEAFCDGLLILSKCGNDYSTSYSISNPVTREHTPLKTAWGFSISSILGMYLHRPTGEYRLLLQRRSYKNSILEFLLDKGEIDYYILVLGSDRPPRYIQRADVESELRFRIPALVRDSLHWFPQQHQSLLVFDTIAESFRKMCAPIVRTNKSNIFEMNGTIGIYSYDDDDAMKVVDIWVLQNYEGEIWKYKYHVELPVTKIRKQFGRREDGWYVSVVSADGDVLLLLSHGGLLFYVGTDGKLVDSFHHEGQHLSANGLRLKQTLVPHNFFMTREDNAVNNSPFI